MPPRLLILEDDEPSRLGMEDYLTYHGYLVDCAGTRKEAEALLARFRFSAVITDLCLGGTCIHEGLLLVDFVRAHHPGARVILLTAHETPEVARQAQERGVDAYLQKPLSLAVMQQRLAALLVDDS